MPTTIVTEQPITVTYIATAAQDTFGFDFQLFNDEDDLVVTVDDVATTAYALELIGDEGGEVVLDTPCAGGEEVTLTRQLALERITQFPSSGPVAMESLNHELNRLLALIQQVSNGSYASITIGTVSTGAAGTDVIITNSGTSTAAVLDITIPRGASGVLGAWGGLTGTLADQTDLNDALALKAALASPPLTGNPTAPTQAVGNDSTRLATTAFVQAELDADRVFVVPVNATALTRRTTGGPALGSSESSANKVMVETVDFDAAGDEFVQCRIVMPPSWNEGTIEVQFGWTAGNTGNVVWAAQGVAISDNDALDAAFGTAQTVTDSVHVADDLMVSAYTPAITLAGTPAAGDLVVLQFYRDGDNGSDTLAVDAKLLFVNIRLTVDTRDDG